MSPKQEKETLVSFLKLAEEPEKYSKEINFKADGLLTISFLLFIAPMHSLVQDGELAFIDLFVLPFSTFGFGFALFYKLSARNVSMLSSYLNVDEIRKNIERKDDK